jgi:hypothetical protein
VAETEGQNHHLAPGLGGGSYLPSGLEPMLAIPRGEIRRHAVPDEAAQSPGLVAFREVLLSAIRARDLEGLLAHTFDHVGLAYGNPYDGKPALRAYLDDASELWDMLRSALEAGGAWADDINFVSPAIAARPPLEPKVPSYPLVVQAVGVPLLSAPDPAAPPLCHMDHELVFATWESRRSTGRFRDSADFIEVETEDGLIGYVSPSCLASPYVFRVAIAKIGDDWKLTYMGDPGSL